MRRVFVTILLVFVLLPVSVSAETYYVDATNGNDAWSGNYPEPQGDPPTDGPWKTWNKVRSQTYSAGDTIRFKRGETWTVGSGERWDVTEDGTSENYITIEDYGSGNKPIIDCQEELNGYTWTSQGSNVWSTTFSGTVYRVRLDGQDSGKAPSSGSVDGSTYLWHHSGSTLYVYATQNPNIEFTNIKVSYASNYIFELRGCNYVKIRKLRLYAGRYGIYFPPTSVESYIEIDGLDIWYGYYAIRSEKSSGGGGSANYITIKNCDIDAKLNLISKVIQSTEQPAYDGIQAHNECDNWTIQNNTFGAYGHNIIALYNPHSGASQGVNNCLVENNIFDGSAGSYCRAITFSGYSGKSTGNIFRYNIIRNMNSRVQFGGNGNEFSYNIIYNITDTPCTNKMDISQGIRVFRVGSGMVCDGAKVYNNVFYDIYNSGIEMGTNSANCLIKNNLCMEADGGGQYGNAVFVWQLGTGHTISNNCFYDADTSNVIYTNGAYRTVAYCDANYPEYSNNVGFNPLFVDAPNGDFRLQPTSPCIDNGTDAGLTIDFEGNPVPQGTAPDIGAYEYQPAEGVCGDGNCSSGETCSSCPDDCKCPTDCTCTSPEICCDGVCSLPACFNESDCGTDPCKVYTCNNPGTCSAHCSSQDITSCINNDSCCPAGCDEGNDNDCVVQTGPVALYHFDENSGNITGDSSGNGNDGTIYGASWTNGISGYALEFDGVDDYIDCGNDNSLNFGTGNFTTSAWIKTNGSSDSWLGIIHKGETTSGQNYQPSYSFSRYTGNNNYFFNAGNWVDKAYFGALEDGQWHHLVGVVEYGEAKAYLDGVYKDNATATNPDHTNPLRIARGVLNRYFNGTIDEVRIYNRTLTQEEILNLYNNPGGEQIPGDLNADGSVDILDLCIIAANFGKTSGFEPRADVVDNNEIDVFDLVFVASRFT